MKIGLYGGSYERWMKNNEDKGTCIGYYVPTKLKNLQMQTTWIIRHLEQQWFYRYFSVPPSC